MLLSFLELTFLLRLDRLMDQQEHLEEQVLSEYQSIYRREAIIELGETFPVIWYSSNIEVTSKQQALMARSVLTAEDLAVIEK